MNVLVACEESQRVCISFREKGHNAFSCDLYECSGGHPEWHINQNVLPLLKPMYYQNGDYGIDFITQNGDFHFINGKWDLIIAHPPCTYLTVSGNAWFNIDKYGDKAIQRISDRKNAIEFFMKFVNADCDKIAIENPIGIMSTRYKKPTQIIQPYMFGDATRKATCLWLKGLPELLPTNIVEPEIYYYKNGNGSSGMWHLETLSLPKEERQKARSKTYWGIARAMAQQWG